VHKTIRRPKGSLGFPAALLALAVACATAVPVPLTLDEKIGQLFVIASTARFMNEQSSEYRELVHQVRDNHVGTSTRTSTRPRF
jgi:hypothetical protein